MLDKTTVLETVGKYAQDVVEAFNPQAVILFGSYANGNPREESDIDVAVIFDGYKGEWLKDSAMLWRIAHKTSYVIEPILLDSTDDRSGFVGEVYRTGHVIYQAPQK
ncbi:MAG: nucleotidyltransferase domain-containing protein [Thermoguttaceae bacterium]